MVTLTKDGTCSFRMYMPNAAEVEVVGSLPELGGAGLLMHRDPGGWWSAQAHVCPGDYEFCYLIDGQARMPDYAAGGLKRDRSGSWVSVLSVPAPETRKPEGCAIPGQDAAPRGGGASTESQSALRRTRAGGGAR